MSNAHLAKNLWLRLECTLVFYRTSEEIYQTVEETRHFRTKNLGIRLGVY